MLECLIAPVRTEHLPSAFEVLKTGDSVQFAASDEALFNRIADRKDQLEVFVFPAGPVSPDYPRDHACMRGIFCGASDVANKAIRPGSTKNDSAWPVYWTLRFIERPEPPLHISNFLTDDGGPTLRHPAGQCSRELTNRTEGGRQWDVLHL